MFGGQQQQQPQLNWGNQQQQQPQQQTNAFGQPVQNAFGAPGGFGQPQQQPQQPLNAFGQPAAQPTNAFGQPAQQTAGFGATQTAGFGQQQPTNAFGAPNVARNAFGQAVSAFGAPANAAPATSAFGSSTAPTNAFGQPANTSAFGVQPQQRPNAFGQPAAGFGAPSAEMPTQGTAAPPYQVTSERDNTTGGVPQTHNYQAISCMPAYRNASLEELRFMDYLQNRRTPGAGGFPSAGFGAPQQTNAFGQPINALGQPIQQPNAFGALGQSQPQPNAFGQPAAPTNAFGQPVQQPNAFGQPQQTQSSAFGQPPQQPTNAFGQPQQPANNAFGQSQPQQPNAFGQPQQQPQQQPAIGGFGQPANPLGLNQPKPFGAFGQPATQPTTMGQQNTGFGQQPSAFGQPQQQSTGFGQQSTGFGQQSTAFGQQPSAFGQPQQPSAFGQPAQATGLGLASQQQQPALGTGPNPFATALANQQQQQQQQQQTGGLGGFGAPAKNIFGQPTTTQQPQQQAPSVFGQPVQQPGETGLQQPNAFGQPAQNPLTAGGAFGQNNQQQSAFGALGQQQQTGGSNTNPFGQNNSQQQTGLGFSGIGLGQQQQQSGSGFGGGAFGAKPQVNPFGSFGQQSTNSLGSTLQSNALGSSIGQPPPGGLFGSFTTSQTYQPSNDRVATGKHFGDNPLFRDVLNTPLEPLTPKSKKLPATYSLIASLASGQTGARGTMKLRGFSASSGTSPFASPFSSPSLSALNASTGDNDTFGRSRNSPHPLLTGISERDGSLSPSAFVSRASAKKLLIDSSAPSPSPLALGSGPSTSPPKQMPTFNPQLEVQAAAIGAPAPVTALAPIPAASPVVSVEAPAVVPQKGLSVVQPAQPAAVGKRTDKQATPAADDGEYWSNPTVDQLSKLDYPKLSSLKDFTVGRRGYGQVQFLVPVDLTQFGSIRDIAGGIVVFDEKVCSVYPNEEEKPAEGEGLNVPARITLEKCWPIDKSTRDPVQDASHPRYPQHVARLKRMANTEFESYTPNGKWTFRVQHFSRYGLDDDSEDEDLPVPPVGSAVAGGSTHEEPVQSDIGMDVVEDVQSPPQASLMDDATEQSEARGSTAPSATQMIVADRTQSARSSVSSSPGASPSDGKDVQQQAHSLGTPRPIAETLGLEARRLHVMQHSFFGEAASQSLVPISQRQTWKPAPFVQAIMEKKTRRELLGSSNDTTVAERRFNAEVPFIQKVRLEQHFDTFSAVKGHEVAVPDAGLFLGRSFRAGWGPNGQIAHLGQLCGTASSAPQVDKLDVVKISSPTLFADDQANEREQTQRLLDLQLAQTTTELGEDNCPSASIRPELRFRDFASLFSAEDRSHEALVWRLGAALFDEIDPRAPRASWDAKSRIEQLLRKDALSGWLEAAVTARVENELRDRGTAETAVFTLLSGHLLERACETAMDAGDVRLATLLSQACSGDEHVRADLLSQIHKWREERIDAHLSVGYRKVYSLLAGEVRCSKGSPAGTDPVDRSTDVLIAKGLDWKRAFGLHLWYGTAFDARVSDAFGAYEGLLEEAPNNTSPPLPWYQEQSTLASRLNKWHTRNSNGLTDGLFEFIKLSSDPLYSLESALSPLGFSPCPVDYRMPWHLYMLLSQVLRIRHFTGSTASGRHDGDNALADRVTGYYANQVERLGLWEYAVFVLLHLKDPSSRIKAIKDLLTRNAHNLTDGLEQLLTEKLRIPGVWIADAKATLARYEYRTFDEFDHLVQASREVDAHVVATQRLAPDAIIRGDLDLVQRIFKELHPHAIPDWSVGGKVYLDYIEARNKLPELLTARSQDLAWDATEQSDLQRLSQMIPRLEGLLPDVLHDRADIRHNVCLGEMLAHLTQLHSTLSLRGLVTQRARVQPALVEEASRLRNLQTDTVHQFSYLVSSVA